jgi:hypothetical protein
VSWLPREGYDVFRINRQNVVMVKGGHDAGVSNRAHWRRLAVAVDLDTAHQIARLLNDELDRVSPLDDVDEHGIPILVRTWLEDRDDGHTIKVTDTGWTLQHSLLCRLGDLFACPVHVAAEDQAEALAVDYGPGCYLVDVEDGLLIVVDRTVG